MKRHWNKLLCILAVVLVIPACTACTMLGSLFTPATVPSATQEAMMQARAIVRESNIAIDTKYMRGTGWFSRTEGESLGSGVVYGEDETHYYALTNHHVITNVVNGITYSTSYTITDLKGFTYAGEVVFQDASKDIAIIRFPKKTGSVLRLIDYTERLEDNVVENEFVLAVGNPSGVKNIVTYGEITGYATIGNVDYEVIFHDALINPGNSGGALCDLDGNLLGLNTWGTEDKDDENFAIPLSVINDFIAAYEAASALN